MKGKHAEHAHISCVDKQGRTCSRQNTTGCYLFNVGIDDLEEDLQIDKHGPKPDIVEHITRTDDYPILSTPNRVGAGLSQPDMSPIGASREPNLALLPRIANVPPWLKKPTEKSGQRYPYLKLSMWMMVSMGRWST